MSLFRNCNSNKNWSFRCFHCFYSCWCILRRRNRAWWPPPSQLYSLPLPCWGRWRFFIPALKVNPFSFAVVLTMQTIRVQKAVDIFPQTAICHKNRRLFQPLYQFSTIGTEKALCYKGFIYLVVCTRDSKTTVSTRSLLSKLNSRSWSMIGSLNRTDFSHCPLGWRSG